MDGILLVNKEAGYTSRDVVNIVSGVFNTKKVGHFGTLDPLATGLLIMGIGSYTSAGKFLKDDTKKYIAKVLIGTSTDTYDITGEVIDKKQVSVSKEEIEKTLNKFIGTYLQEVPIYSAVKVSGKKLYEYAREKKKVDLPKKKVTIFDIKLLSFSGDTFTFECKVSKGTYIRSLINDISKKLGIPMCMKSLERTMQDKFSLSDSYTLDDIKSGKYKLLNIRDIIDVLEMEIPSELEKKVLNGSKIDKITEGFVLFTKENIDIVLYKSYENEMKPVLRLLK